MWNGFIKDNQISLFESIRMGQYRCFGDHHRRNLLHVDFKNTMRVTGIQFYSTDASAIYGIELKNSDNPMELIKVCR